MQREFFCCGCGLFHWHEQYVTDENGIIRYNPYKGCPNPDCISHERDDVAYFAVDTFGYAYFCDSESGKEILKKKWSSPKYASDEVIEIYRKQGIEIR